MLLRNFIGDGGRVQRFNGGLTITYTPLVDGITLAGVSAPHLRILHPHDSSDLEATGHSRHRSGLHAWAASCSLWARAGFFRTLPILSCLRTICQVQKLVELVMLLAVNINHLVKCVIFGNLHVRPVAWQHVCRNSVSRGKLFILIDDRWARWPNRDGILYLKSSTRRQSSRNRTLDLLPVRGGHLQQLTRSGSAGYLDHDRTHGRLCRGSLGKRGRGRHPGPWPGMGMELHMHLRGGHTAHVTTCPRCPRSSDSGAPTGVLALKP
mmetsp:Transcript_42044/g.97967  ORF Transcript_42044/g.97967 Transcript_42044/m.97967 type:complete len:266 (+) Transcript_42044:1503-2300(+)